MPIDLCYPLSCQRSFFLKNSPVGSRKQSSLRCMTGQRIRDCVLCPYYDTFPTLPLPPQLCPMPKAQEASQRKRQKEYERKIDWEECCQMSSSRFDQANELMSSCQLESPTQDPAKYLAQIGLCSPGPTPSQGAKWR